MPYRPGPKLLRAPAVSAVSSRILTRRHGHKAARSLDLPAGDAFANFLEACTTRPSTAPTACEGWTAHELVAHLAAGSAEIARLANRALSGEGEGSTRAFEDREPEYRQMDPIEVRRAFVAEGMRAAAAILELEAANQALLFTGHVFSPAQLIAHAEAELVLHRWDLTGDDDPSISALARPAMLEHAVDVVAMTSPHVIPYQLRPDRSPAVTLRSPGQRDVVIEANSARFVDKVAADMPVVELHPAARVLALWGRRSTGELGRMAGDPEAVRAAYRALCISEASRQHQRGRRDTGRIAQAPRAATTLPPHGCHTQIHAQ